MLECRRAARRASHRRLLQTVDQVLEAIYLLEITPAIFDEAARVDPPFLRSLDAIHLATALSIDDEALEVITYDERFADAARAARTDRGSTGMFGTLCEGAVTERRRYNRRQQPMMNRPALTTLITIGRAVCIVRGRAVSPRNLQRKHRNPLYPVEAPAMLLPPGSVQVEARNASSASARILERLQDRMARQLGDNDKRLRVVGRDGGVVLVATLTEWKSRGRTAPSTCPKRGRSDA